MRRWLRRDGGQAVVEFALVLPLIAIFLLGMMQIGLALNTRQQLEGVARQGARTFALTADPDLSVAAVRLAGRQIKGFDSASWIEMTATDERGKVTKRGNIVLDPPALAAGELARRYSFPSAASVRRGDWVTVALTYNYPNPIQASVFGFRLPATIPFGTSATARIEFDQVQAVR